MRAGFYRVDITPKEEGRIFTNEYGKNVMLVPHDVGDNMYARILVVDDGENKQVVISTDLCTSNEEDVFCYDTRLGVRKLTSQWPGGTKDYISELTGVSVQNIYLMATHNHLAPTCCQSINIVKELATGVKRAIENLEEVQLSYTETDYNLVKNRRPWSNTLNTELPHDTKVRILLFYNKSGKMIGAIINYACHGTILRYGPYPHKISGEFIGIGMSKIEEKMGNGFVSMFMQGASGDNGPVIDKDYSFVVHCGRRLANIVLDALEKNTLDFSNNKEILTVDKVVSVKKAIYPATNENANIRLNIFVFIRCYLLFLVVIGIIPRVDARGYCTFWFIGVINWGRICEAVYG